MKKYLIIDGNYYANRVLGQLNIKEKENTLDTPNERINFMAALKNGLIDLYMSFKPYVDNLIFVTDCGDSWRKSIVYRPWFYIGDDHKDTPIKYKEQRKKLKAKSKTNWNAFYQVYDDFIDLLTPDFNVININGLEGDDNVALLANKVRTSNMMFITFCTDGDMEQNVNNRSIIFRNTRSKALPNGEFIINSSIYDSTYKASAEDIMLGAVDTNLKDLFSFNLYSDKYNCKRKLNDGIRLAQPFKRTFTKCITGDKKDNIFPILKWFKGGREFGVTEKMLIKAFTKLGLVLCESHCIKVIKSKELLENLLVELISITKLKAKFESGEFTLDDLIAHLKHNMRINILSLKNIPEDLQEEFEGHWNNLNFDMMEIDYINNKLKSTNVDQTSNIYEESIPQDLSDMIVEDDTNEKQINKYDSDDELDTLMNDLMN